MSVSEYYIPATQSYSPIEPAFACSEDQEALIPLAWGAKSRVVGGCQAYRGDVGQCLGTFRSQDVDTRDTPWKGLLQENQQVPEATPQGPPSPVVAAAPLRTLKNAPPVPPRVAPPQPKAAPSQPDQPAPLHPALMPYSVFDVPFLPRTPTTTSDPAAWLTGVPSYTNLRLRNQQATATPSEPWGLNSSYGTYAALPSGTLHSQCVLGQRV